MDLIKNKAVIINACVGGGWYPAGSKRLANSLNHVGWAGSVLQWVDKWPNFEFDQSCKYHVKAAAFAEAIKQGFTHILWCDSSAWAIADPMPIFDYINENGYFFWQSGYNCAQVSSDKSLQILGLNRDQVECWPDVSSSIMGVNVTSDIGFQFINDWLLAAHKGVFKGSRLHGNQSADPRFLFHRQDQTAASLIAGKMGLKTTLPNEYCGYYSQNNFEKLCFFLRGI